jgi:hypothetical protein
MLSLLPLAAVGCFFAQAAAADESIKAKAGPLTVEAADPARPACSNEFNSHTGGLGG